MGCDIHGWVEVKHNGKWIAISNRFGDLRNYERFAMLASVRGISNRRPLGIPKDLSETAKYSIESLGDDGHSHSYMPIKEAADIFLATTTAPTEYEEKYPVSAFFEVDPDDEREFRLVFWFDN